MQIRTLVEVEYTPLNMVKRVTGIVKAQIKNFATNYLDKGAGANFRYFSDNYPIVGTGFEMNSKESIDAAYDEIKHLLTPGDSYYDNREQESYTFLMVKMANDFGLEVNQLELYDETIVEETEETEE